MWDWANKSGARVITVLVTLLVVMLVLFVEQLIVGSSFSKGYLSGKDNLYKDTYLSNILSSRVLYTELPSYADFVKVEKEAKAAEKSSFAPPSTIALSVRNGTGEHNNSWGACTTGAVYGSDSLAANISSGDSQQNFKTGNFKQGFSDNELAAQL